MNNQIFHKKQKQSFSFDKVSLKNRVEKIRGTVWDDAVFIGSDYALVNFNTLGEFCNSECTESLKAGVDLIDFCRDFQNRKVAGVIAKTAEGVVVEKRSKFAGMNLLLEARRVIVSALESS